MNRQLSITDNYAVFVRKGEEGRSNDEKEETKIEEKEQIKKAKRRKEEKERGWIRRGGSRECYRKCHQ